MSNEKLAPIMGIDRLRMGTDGNGITSLVTFYGCPPCCKYCLNPQCHSELSDTFYLCPKDVYESIAKDELYYLATRGGVTFGGGEPLLYSDFINDILDLGAKRWNVTIETSLNVPYKQIEKLLPYVNEMFVDVKDVDSQIYKSYTQLANDVVIENLKQLVNISFNDNVLIRLPKIKGYNTNGDIQKSKRFLESIGYSRFDIFEYKTNFRYERQGKM